MKNFSEISWRGKYSVEKLQDVLDKALAAEKQDAPVAEEIAEAQAKPIEVIKKFLAVHGAFAEGGKGLQS